MDIMISQKSLLDDDDALREILLRTGEGDHVALRNTCRRFRKLVDSLNFQTERVLRGFANIHIRLVSQEYHDRNDIDDIMEGADVSERFGAPPGSILEWYFWIDVDDESIASGCLSLVSQSTDRFHELCCGRSRELYETACLLFDNSGRPRVDSLRKATSDDNGKNKGVLFLHDVKWRMKEDFLHCLENPWFGAAAVRRILQHSRILDKWSVALYLPHPHALFTVEDHMVEQEASNHNDYFSMVACPETSSSTQMQERHRRRQEWKSRCQSLTEQDRRQFLIAGFHQVTETCLRRVNCNHMFAVPSCLLSPLPLSQQEPAFEVIRKPIQSPGAAVNVEYGTRIRHLCEEQETLDREVFLHPPPTENQVRRIVARKLQSRRARSTLR